MIGVVLDESSSPSVQFIKLVRGRNDLSIFLDFTLTHLARKNGFSPADFVPVLLLDDAKKYYITLSKETAPATVEAFRAAFRKMRRSGELRRIVDRHLKPLL